MKNCLMNINVNVYKKYSMSHKYDHEQALFFLYITHLHIYTCIVFVYTVYCTRAVFPNLLVVNKL